MIELDRIIRSVGMANHLLLSSLLAIEKHFELDDLVVLNDKEVASQDTYFLQFDHQTRQEASRMAKHYEVFYCLEKSIRELISDIIEATHGADWWRKGIIPDNVYQDVEKNIQKEQDSAITPRSSYPIDYTTFGQLGEIIKLNWQVFGGIFTSVRAVERVLNNLNSLRNPIAHCSPLAEDEVLRLHLGMRDWFRLSSS